MSMNYDEFISYLKHEKRYSLNTIEAYKRDLNDFIGYLAREYELDEITQVSHSLIRSWILKLLESGISVTSVKRKISTLRSFYKYLLRMEKIEVNPMTKILAPKSSKHLPTYVKEEDIQKLLNQMSFSSDFSGVRDHLIIELFYQTGIRVSELLGLKASDIDFENNQLKVLGKRNKERIIPISIKLTSILSVYNREKRKEFSSENSQLIVLDNGQKAYRKFVYDKVNYYLSQVSSLSKRSPHVLRHTFATHMLKNGADLNSIKEILGHASLAATQVYAHNSLEQLKQAHMKAHPRN